ncbi:MAG: Ion channel [Candidatus Peregrinibacteria bacterium GW2011_GWF2_43_17]|nr:MAG: Ion channel [Candidatus Peregrinibacteria bacterium GW2011_GWF2_43_17]KKT18716.1 MAG: Ion channel [Candidatus Peregrinibacteria bacterium GW2011_GWA2_43_8]HAU40405.1 hypothetical protein [Candidatus Peregrinibacteria bacterium]
MNFREAIDLIEQRGDFNEFAELRSVFEKRLEELGKSDYTERGLTYYYLLLSVLKAHLVHETEECRDFYIKMDDEFKRQSKKYKKDGDKFSKFEINDFYHLMERCYSTLEIIYTRKNFSSSKKKSYERKMAYRQAGYWFDGKYSEWLEYKFLELTSLYGDSFTRWGLTTLAVSAIFAVLYFLLDLFASEADKIVSDLGGHWFDYFYFSIVTFTTLGVGDFLPQTIIAKALACGEVLSGFVMLSIFVALVQRKF